jgi:hypothetical protein
MSSRTTTPARADQATVSTPLRALRYLALLSTLNLICQGISAGELLMESHTFREVHEVGAIVLHVLCGLTALAAIWYWRTSKAGLSIAVLSALVFIATFVQAWYGHGRTLYIHVPLAMLLMIGAGWVLAWSWLMPARRSAQ